MTCLSTAEGTAMSGDASLIFFSGAMDLADADAHLARTHLFVRNAGSALHVSSDEGPTLCVTHERGAAVTKMAREIGQGTAHAPALALCDACFRVAIDDLSDTLDEANTLIETQLTLQSMTMGVMYDTWNHALSAWESEVQ